MSVQRAHISPDCPHCDDLRYEVEQLRIQLGQQTELLTRHAIARTSTSPQRGRIY